MNKEFRSRNSRAERGRLRHISYSRECASSRSFLCNREFRRNFLLHKKAPVPDLRIAKSWDRSSYLLRCHPYCRSNRPLYRTPTCAFHDNGWIPSAATRHMAFTLPSQVHSACFLSLQSHHLQLSVHISSCLLLLIIGFIKYVLFSKNYHSYLNLSTNKSTFLRKCRFDQKFPKI